MLGQWQRYTALAVTDLPLTVCTGYINYKDRFARNNENSEIATCPFEAVT